MAHQGRPRTCGMRFSVVDALAIVVAAVGTALLWPLSPELAILVPFTLGHFFLFCNVFRVRRLPELVWAGVFLLNAGAWLLNGSFSWLGVCAVQLPLTAFLLWRETRMPWYHGVMCRRWNARHIEAYLRGEI